MAINTLTKKITRES